MTTPDARPPEVSDEVLGRIVTDPDLRTWLDKDNEPFIADEDGWRGSRGIRVRDLARLALAQRAEIAGLREGLAFYADEANWTVPIVPHTSQTPCEADGGLKARALLARGGEGV